ncbi:MAG: type II toxin-antitoxin system RelE/ParE family toxin [Sulfuricellaceae bacterium]
MSYTITYYSESVEADIEALPITLKSKYIVLSRRMIEVGANLGEPHTEAFGGGLFELRLNLESSVDRLLGRVTWWF